MLLPHNYKNCPHCFILSDTRLEYLEKIGIEGAKQTREESNRLRGERNIRGLLPLNLLGSTQLVAAKKDRRIYDAKNSFRRAHPSDLVQTEGGSYNGSPEAQEDAKFAYEFAGATYDFYNKIFERNSIDDNGLVLHSTVRFRLGWINAMWDGSTMSYGDRMSKCIDVVAHELTHGVTQYEAGLIYENESGALNEHFSDVMGILVKQWSLNQSATDSNWLIGENIVPGLTAIRSMKDPGSLEGDDQVNENNEPIDHYDKIYRGLADHGGVHKNSGIPNKAFYLAATNIGGNAWEKVGSIWYIALRDRLHPTSTFQEAADITYKIATEYHDHDVQKAIKQAWKDVGIDVQQEIDENIRSLIGVRRP
jgi:Zn-dependent metalloprotease